MALVSVGLSRRIFGLLSIWNFSGPTGDQLSMDGATATATQSSARSDAELLRRAAACPGAFREIYDRHVRVVRRFLGAQVGPDLADDLTAETFVIALQRSHDYVDATGSARGWLLGIAANLARRSRRSRSRGMRMLQRLPLPREADVDAFVERLDVHGLSRELAAALTRISFHEREVLVMVALGELSYDEVSLALGVPVGTVRSRLHRARASMRAALTEGSHDL